MKRLIISISILFMLWAGALPAQAVSSFCFTEDMCAAQDGTFRKGEKPCAGDLGLCYSKEPEVDLLQPIGTTRKVRGLAQYIAVSYQYFVGVGVIVAVVMMTIGGMQWMTAGGSQTRVTSGKTKITNAVIGLALLIGSYTILLTINPALVTLKPLQAPLTRKELFTGGGTCETFKGVKFALKADKEFDTLKKDDFKPFEEHGGGFKAPECGKEYFIEDAGGDTCQGVACQTTYVCDLNESKCVQGALAGKVIGNKRSDPPYIYEDGASSDIGIAVLCADGSIQHAIAYRSSELAKFAGQLSTIINKGDFNYLFPNKGNATTQAISDAEAKCSGGASDAFIFAHLNDTEFGIGGVSLGANDRYGIGMDKKVYYPEGMKSSKRGPCELKINIAKHFPGVKKGNADVNEDVDDFSKDDRKSSNEDALPSSSKEQYNCTYPLCMKLIPIEELKKGQLNNCNIILSKEEFPPL